MSNRTEKANARLAGVKGSNRFAIVATAYANSAQSTQARKALAQKMRDRAQQNSNR